MADETFRERNRRNREQMAFENFYEYARRTNVPDPKRAAERAARSLHGEEQEGGTSQAPRESGENIPHRLEDRTRDQLYTRAQELEIEGRSQMTKDELIEALRRR